MSGGPRGLLMLSARAVKVEMALVMSDMTSTGSSTNWKSGAPNKNLAENDKDCAVMLTDANQLDNLHTQQHPWHHSGIDRVHNWHTWPRQTQQLKEKQATRSTRFSCYFLSTTTTKQQHFHTAYHIFHNAHCFEWKIAQQDMCGNVG